MEGNNRYYSNQTRRDRETNQWRDPYNRKGDYHQPDDYESEGRPEGQQWTSNYPTSDESSRGPRDRYRERKNFTSAPDYSSQGEDRWTGSHIRDFSAQSDVRWPAGENYVSPSKWQERDREPGMRPGYFNHYQSDYAQKNAEPGVFSGRGPKGYQRSDERIREDVCEALMRSSQVDASGIEVDVKDGVVTLKGTVDERRMKRLAEDCTERVSSVRDVRNEITLSNSDRAESMLSPRANSTVNKSGKKEQTDDSVGKSMN